MNAGSNEEAKVLICAPLGKDAEILGRIADFEQLPFRKVENLAEVTSDISSTMALLLLLSEEVLNRNHFETFKTALIRQEPWSDIPIILVASGGAVASPVTNHFVSLMSDLANISIVERPARTATLRSALRVARSARRRQFQVRDLFRREEENLCELRKALEELKTAEQSNRLLAAIVNSSDDAIVSKNLDGIITSWNVGAERLFGYSSAEAIGHPISIIIPVERLEEEPRILGSIRRGESIDHFETVRVRKDGALLDISLTISPVRDASGTIVGASKVARDITRQKRAEADLRASESRFRELAGKLESEVEMRTAELQARNAEVVRKSEELRELSARLMAVQDEERRHIARELHDSAGQTITALGMNLGRIAREIKTAAPQLSAEVEESADLVRQLSHEIRTASYLLHPPLLDESGLAAAIQTYVHGVQERGGPVVTVQIDAELKRLSSDVELVIFRVVQESLTNIVRHSGSNTAVIRIRALTGRVEVEVQDFGRGMSAQRLGEVQAQGAGVGIRGMRERVRPFGGEIAIISDSNGTTIRLNIPVTGIGDD
jgi:PAS domain S-box-containing protein